MSDGEQGKGTNKVVLILGGLILVAVVVMFALRSGGGPAGELAGTYVAEGQEGIIWVEKEIAVPEVEKPEVKTPEVQEVKKPVLPKALRQLTPEETVESFTAAVLEERYDDAMKYVSPQNRWIESKWSLIELHGSLYQSVGGDITETKIVGVEYLDKPQTMAEVTIYVYGNKDETWYIELQKENEAWKII